MTTASLAQALIRDKFLINFNNLVSNPMRTGIQRVCYEFSTRWPFIDDTVAFVELGMDRIGILDPDFFESVRQLFEDSDHVLHALAREFGDLGIDPSPGWLALLSARNRIICEISVEEALECCRAVISLEESLNLEFFSLAAATRPEKVFNLCHDFLSWTHSEFFSTDWRVADNVSLSLANRRKYSHNIFTSTTTRDVFVNRINRGDVRPYRVIAPGADGLGRTYRKSAPDSPEFLVVGTLEPRKQSLHILHAFERLQAQGHDARLCFAGRMGWLEPEDKAELRAAFARYSWVRWIDSPADDELRDLMMNCRATIYMSLAEGFGSPPVESLALGVPCIVTADLPSILDLASNGQVRVDGHDGQGLEDAVRRLLDDEAVLALQAEIETLELPTWQAFVDGIAALIVEKTAVQAQSAPATSYRTRLDILASLSLMRQFDRDELIEHLVSAAVPGIGEGEMAKWLIRADRAEWSNVEVVLNLLAAFPRVFPASLVNEAVAGSLEATSYIPSGFIREWQARFRRFLQIPSFPAFYEAIYTDLLMRNPGPGEIDAHIPYDESTQPRTAYLRGAIESGEYHDRLEAGIRHKLPEGYADAIVLPTIKWKLRVLDLLAVEAAVDRASLVDDDSEFLDIASLDLTGQLLSRAGRDRLLAVLKERYGRDKVLLRLLLSEAGLRRVQDPQAHLALIHRLALRAGLVRPERSDERSIVGKVNALSALPRQSFQAGGAEFLGRELAPVEQVLADFGSASPPSVSDARGADSCAPLFAARLVLYATLCGDIVPSPTFITWAAERLAGDGPASSPRGTSDRPAGRMPPFSSPEATFAAVFDRAPEAAEASVLVEAAGNGLTPSEIFDGVRIAALRAGQVTDLLSEITHFAQEPAEFIARFERLDALAEDLLASAPETRRRAWSRPVPSPGETAPPGHVTSQAGALAPALRLFDGEVVSVDQLMAIDGVDFVRTAYRKLLLREADEGGIQTYRRAMEAGRSKAAVIYSLCISAEGKAADANLVGLDGLLVRQRKMRRWPVRKLLQVAGVPL